MAWFLGVFFWGGGGRGVREGEGVPSLQNFWAIHPRVCGDGAFPGGFLAGELGENFVFFAVVATIFCIC